MTELLTEHIFLIGFLDSGNIALGKRLAEAVKLPFVDTNKVLAQLVNTDLLFLYRDIGPEAYAKLQHQAFQKVTAGTPSIVAVTDTTPLHDADWHLFTQTGKTIYIQHTAERLYWRLRFDPKQPALWGTQNEERHQRIAVLLAEREPTYLKANLVVPCKHEQISDLVNVIKTWLTTQTPGSALATSFYRKEAKT